MKCSAWLEWDLVKGKMVPTEFCPNEATHLLSNRPHWENQPYCGSCAFWIMNGFYSNKYAKGIEDSSVSQRQ